MGKPKAFEINDDHVTNFESGICLFCGEIPEERYFSGGCEAYTECYCENRREYFDAKNHLLLLSSHAIRKAETLAEEKQLIDLEDEEKRIHNQAEELRKKLSK